MYIAKVGGKNEENKAALDVVYCSIGICHKVKYKILKFYS